MGRTGTQTWKPVQVTLYHSVTASGWGLPLEGDSMILSWAEEFHIYEESPISQVPHTKPPQGWLPLSPEQPPRGLQ